MVILATNNSTEKRSSIISNTTTKEPVTLALFYPISVRFACGHLLTPPSCVLGIRINNLVAKGRDSNYKVGPVVDSEVDE